MLEESRRQQLDDIVRRMSANGESEDSISFVVNDFKNKYSTQEPEKSFLEKTAGVLDAIFGGGKIGEAIGTKIAEKSAAGKLLKQQEAQGIAPKGTFAETFKQPTKGQLAGSALQSGALFIPAGAGAKAITTGARALGMKTGVSALGKIGAGVAAGEVFDIASNLQQGKTGAQALTPGFGALIGGAIPAAGVAKNVVVRFGDKQAPRIINSLIKPLQKDFAYGKNPGRAIAEEGIVANDFDELINKIRESRQTIGQSIGTLSESLSSEPVLSVRNSFSPIDDAIKVAASQNNQSLLSRLNNVKRSLTEVLEPAYDDSGNIVVKSIGSRDLDNLTFKQVRNILGDVGDLTAFTGNPSDDKLVNSALKQVYGNIKGESLKAARNINPQIAQQFEKATEKYGDLMSAEIAAKYRDKIIERQNLIGLSPQVVGIGSGLLTAVATGGATLPAVLVGLSGASLDKLASTPGFKTRLAYLLSTKSEREARYLFSKIPALKKFFNTKDGLTPGDIILGKTKKIIQNTNNISNTQKGSVSKDLLKAAAGVSTVPALGYALETKEQLQNAQKSFETPEEQNVLEAKNKPKSEPKPATIKSNVPEEYVPIVKEATQDGIISPNALAAMINTENGMWDEEYVNPNGTDTGLGQHNDQTYQDIQKLFKKKYGREYDRKNGEDNIKATALWMNHLAKNYDHINSIYDVAGAYRVGAQGYKKYLEGKGTAKFTPEELKSLVEDKQKSFREFYD